LRQARQFLLVDTEKRAGGLHLRTCDHGSVYNDVWNIINRIMPAGQTPIAPSRRRR